MSIACLREDHDTVDLRQCIVWRGVVLYAAMIPIPERHMVLERPWAAVGSALRHDVPRATPKINILSVNEPASAPYRGCAGKSGIHM